MSEGSALFHPCHSDRSALWSSYILLHVVLPSASWKLWSTISIYICILKLKLFAWSDFWVKISAVCLFCGEIVGWVRRLLEELHSMSYHFSPLRALSLKQFACCLACCIILLIYESLCHRGFPILYMGLGRYNIAESAVM